MPCKIIWEEMGILAFHSGTVTDEEVKAGNDMMYGDKRFETIAYQISDYTEATNIQITPRDAKVIGALDKTASRWNRKKMRMAVVTKDEKFIPIVKTYFKEFEGTASECRIFESLDMAYNWVKSEY
ncbi:MAG: hypothetical protein WCK84_11430 [Bacteroidota bacterium]